MVRVERIGLQREDVRKNLQNWTTRLKPEKIVLFGSCGWLDEPHKCEVGRIYAIKSAIKWDEPELIEHCNMAMIDSICASANITKERVMTTDGGVIETRVARALFETAQAPLVDMETFYAAEWCSENSIPFASVRAITDLAGDNAEVLFHQNLRLVMNAAAKIIAPAIINLIEEWQAEAPYS